MKGRLTPDRYTRFTFILFLNLKLVSIRNFFLSLNQGPKFSNSNVSPNYQLYVIRQYYFLIHKFINLYFIAGKLDIFPFLISRNQFSVWCVLANQFSNLNCLGHQVSVIAKYCAIRTNSGELQMRAHRGNALCKGRESLLHIVVPDETVCFMISGSC